MHGAFSALKKDFEKRQDTVKVFIEGGGSKTGLMAIKEGSADVGLSSYEFDLDSVLGSNHGVNQKIVAYDGIVLISHTDNPVLKLNNQQVAGIFSGRYTDWRQVGGYAGRIVPIVRDSNSGTQAFFTEYFKIEKVNPVAVVADENKVIVTRVQENQNAIGYIGFGYFTDSANSLEIAQKDEVDSQFVSATFKNLGSGMYPLKRSLRMYYRDHENPALQAFMTYLQSQDAQLIIQGQGLMPQSINDNLASR